MPNWAWMLIIVFVALAFFEDLRRGAAADRRAGLARRYHRVLVLGGDDRLNSITQAQLQQLVQDAHVHGSRREGLPADLGAREAADDVAQHLELVRGDRLKPGSRLLN